MAEQNDSRAYRARDPQNDRRSDDLGASDPLAELARLIGQTDPFAERERARFKAAESQADHSPQNEDDEDWAPRAAAPRRTQTPPEPMADEYDYSTQSGVSSDPRHFADQGYGQYEGQPPSAESEEGYSADYAAYYGADAEALEEAEYQEEQARRLRRRRLMTVAAIIGFAIVGSAGAYGYRTYFVHKPRTSFPPVIMADTGPTKVIPASARNGSANKLSYDRVGEQSQSEKMVPREENPVDLKTAAVTPPRAVYSAPAQNGDIKPPEATIAVAGEPGAGSNLPAATSTSAIPMGSGVLLPSPKKVKTVSIRPDMSVVPNGSDPIMEAASVPSSEAPVRTASVPRSVPEAAPSRTPAVSARAPNPPPARAPAARPEHHAMAPLSLSPDGSGATATERTARSARAERQPLALASTAPSAAPAGVMTTVPAGGYVVQISSQRSEADAKASFRALQAKYRNLLGGRQPIVRRADLGSKGVYYRTVVGPFASAEQADSFCKSLKAAGGQCLIHRN